MINLSPIPYPWLIQRIYRVQKRDDRIGIDSLFSFDYMGAAEYEFGAVNAALMAMRDVKNRVGVDDISQQFNNGIPTILNAFFVGTMDCFELAKLTFEDQLRYPYQVGKTKAPTYLYQSYVQDPKWRTVPFDGWWALDAPTPFLLFRSKVHALEWVDLL